MTKLSRNSIVLTLNYENKLCEPIEIKSLISVANTHRY